MRNAATIIAVGVAITLCAGAARAQSLTIDDFATGPVTIQFNGATQTGDLLRKTLQLGSGIVGGRRQTWLWLEYVDNPWLQNAGLEIKPAFGANPASLVFGEGFQADAAVNVMYGYTGVVRNQLQNLDLTPYNRFRATFAGFNGDDKFLLSAYSSEDLSASSSWACNISATSTTFTVDMPFANGDGNADLSKIRALVYFFESAGQGGQDFALTKLEAVPPSVPQGDVTCPPIGQAQMPAPRRSE